MYCRMGLVLGIILAIAAPSASAAPDETQKKRDDDKNALSESMSNVVLGQKLIEATERLKDLDVRLAILNSIKSQSIGSIGSQPRVNESKRQSQDNTKMLSEVERVVESVNTQINLTESLLTKELAAILDRKLTNPTPPAVNLNPPPAAAAVAPPPPGGAPPAPGDQTHLPAPADAGTNNQPNRNEAQDKLSPTLLQQLAALQARLDELRRMNRDCENAIESSESINQDLTRSASQMRGKADQLLFTVVQIDALQRPIPTGFGGMVMAQPVIGGISPLGANTLEHLVDLVRRPNASSSSPSSGSVHGPPPPAVVASSKPAFTGSTSFELIQAREIINSAQSENNRLRQAIAQLKYLNDDLTASSDESQTNFNDATTALAKAQAALTTREAALIKEKDDTEEKKARAELLLSKRDTDLSQNYINTLLVWAVFLMIGLIAMLFTWLRWFDPDLVSVFIRNRVLIEILSMGFLLLTVIILGTGNKIQAEGLAGILGTIAGYIFARKTAELERGNSPVDNAGAVQRAKEAVRDAEDEHDLHRGILASILLAKDKMTKRDQLRERRSKVTDPADRGALDREIDDLNKTLEKIESSLPKTASSQKDLEAMAEEEQKKVDAAKTKLDQANAKLRMLKDLND